VRKGRKGGKRPSLSTEGGVVIVQNTRAARPIPPGKRGLPFGENGKAQETNSRRSQTGTPKGYVVISLGERSPILAERAPMLGTGGKKRTAVGRNRRNFGDPRRKNAMICLLEKRTTGHPRHVRFVKEKTHSGEGEKDNYWPCRYHKRKRRPFPEKKGGKKKRGEE